MCPSASARAHAIMTTLELNQSSSTLQPVLLPHERRRLCPAHAPTIPQPALPVSSVPDVAICLFGMLARYIKRHPTSCRVYSGENSGCKEDMWLTRAVGYSSLSARVIQPNSARYSIDVFVHTWSEEASDFVHKTFKPRAASFGKLGRTLPPASFSFGWPPDAAPGMFASIDSVLDLKRRAEQERGSLYHWVLLARIDLVWLSTFQFDVLDPSLLYLANKCVEDRKQLKNVRQASTPCASPVRSGHTSSPAAAAHAVEPPVCRQVRLKPSSTTAPDWYFAANSTLIDHAFRNVTWYLERYCFRPTFMMSGNHKVVAGYWAWLGLWRLAGRYLQRSFDFAMLRDKFVDRALPCFLAQAGWSHDECKPVLWRRKAMGRRAVATHWEYPAGMWPSRWVGNLSAPWRLPRKESSVNRTNGEGGNAAQLERRAIRASARSYRGLQTICHTLQTCDCRNGWQSMN